MNEQIKSNMFRGHLVWHINAIITAKATRMGAGYYTSVNNLIKSGYSQQRARFAALNPETWTVKK